MVQQWVVKQLKKSLGNKPFRSSMLSAIQSLFWSNSVDDEKLTPEQRQSKLVALRSILERSPDFKVGDYVFLDPEVANLGLWTKENLPEVGYVLQMDDSFERDWPFIDPSTSLFNEKRNLILAADATESTFDKFRGDSPSKVFICHVDARSYRAAPLGFSASLVLQDFQYDSSVDAAVSPGTLVRFRKGHGLMESRIQAGPNSYVASSPLIVLARPSPPEPQGIKDCCRNRRLNKQPTRIELAYFAKDKECEVARTVLVYPFEVCPIPPVIGV